MRRVIHGIGMIAVGLVWLLAVENHLTAYTVQHEGQFYLGAALFGLLGLALVVWGLIERFTQNRARASSNDSQQS